MNRSAPAVALMQAPDSCLLACCIQGPVSALDGRQLRDQLCFEG